jgi:hypothetical protein
LESPEDLSHHILLHDGSPDADDSCPDWAMWLAARGIKSVDGARGPRFNQSSMVIEAAANGRGVAFDTLAMMRTLGFARLRFYDYAPQLPSAPAQSLSAQAAA